MWEYTKKVKELFLHPKNVGEIKDADATGEAGSIICGDALKLTLRIDKETGRIMDARFQTFGCASAIASSTALTELIKGKTIDEALKISNKDIAEYLGGLPREKMHCSVMGQEALVAAVADYRGEKPPEVEEGKLVCECFGITDEKIKREARKNNLRTVEDVTNFTKAGGGCEGCVPEIEKILKEVWAEKEPDKPALPKKKLTNIRKISMLQDVIETEIRPLLQADGGDIELVDFENNKVTVSLRGTCKGCLMSEVTMTNIEKKLKELIGDEISVEVE